MTNIKCKNCDNDISIEATFCPNCGHPIKKTFCLSIGQLLLFVICVLGLLSVIVIGMEIHFENKRYGTYEQVAADAVEQYNNIKRTGNHAKICLHARIVSAAYLQANDKEKHQQWKVIEQDDCRL